MNLEIHYKEKTGKSTNLWRLNNMLLNNQRGNKDIKGEIKKCLDTNENGSTIYQNLWDEAKAVVRGEFIMIQSYSRNKRNMKGTV